MKNEQTYFKARNIAEVLKDGLSEPPKRMIAGPWLFENTTHYLFSRPNYGKSLMAFGYAWAASTGESLADCEVLRNQCEPMKTLLVDLELEDTDFAERYTGVLASMKPEHINNLVVLHEKMTNKMEVGLKLLERIEQAAIEHEAKLVTIDNLSKLLPDSLKAKLVGEVISSLNRIRCRLNCAILVIGHTVKGNRKIAIQPNDYFGSSMVENFFYHISYLDMTQDGKFYLCHSKIKKDQSQIYDKIVPVFIRGKHQKLGTGFTFEKLLPVESVRLPSGPTGKDTSRKRNLSKFRDELELMEQAGIKRNTIAEICQVSKAAISKILGASG